jgi:hypothetical protein
MASGFQSMTDGGIFQIDDTYRNLSLVHSGQGTLGQASMNAFNSALAQCSPYSQIAWKFTSSPGGGGFPFMGEFAGGGRKTYIDYSVQQAFAQWYIFDVIAPRATENVGLEVFNANGELCFASSALVMRVLDLTGRVRIDYNREVVVYTNNTGRDVAYMPCRSNLYFDYDGQNEEYGYGFLRINGNQLVVSGRYDMVENGGGSITLRTEPCAVNMMVVDVTGYPANYSRL